MIPVIKTISAKKLIGLNLNMSFIDNKTAELWCSFMPKRKEIANSISNDMYSLQVYNENFFSQFNPATEFKKWALAEVTDFNTVPKGMETFDLEGGMYAVFYYKGNPANAVQVFGYIMKEWLPQSGYVLDNRPHFEVLGEKYKNGSDESEEEIWIPIR
ncbi:GyrI-like domain-containing protein [Flavobacterium rakeshii]|uniref:GyrI-like domain-containing protein n=1 Tax=Flavobacterium rakeshii TaxID=1038845 RepID=UPI002E7B21AD|nr:GyrI-like domain-containing protein [Flavobacterium rakeshii]MEE1899548.1 GyrI-like domain-containing protein [Flavobacterium rakeshii]